MASRWALHFLRGKQDLGSQAREAYVRTLGRSGSSNLIQCDNCPAKVKPSRMMRHMQKVHKSAPTLSSGEAVPRVRKPSQMLLASRADKAGPSGTGRRKKMTNLQQTNKILHSLPPREQNPKRKRRKAKVIPEFLPLEFAPPSKTTWDSGYPDPRPSRKQSVKKKVRKNHESWNDGQPRFEGGIRWEQGGSPGLGKRR